MLHCFLEKLFLKHYLISNFDIARETFFQDMLNRVVQIVHRGLIRPTDGARFLHGCASILNMRLLKESPSTTVIVRGLKKMNDLAQGHHFLVKTFAAYGDIIDASISPKNKGFGKLPKKSALHRDIRP